MIVDSRRFIAQQNLIHDFGLPVLQDRGPNPGLPPFSYNHMSNSFSRPTRSQKKGFVIKKGPKRGSGSKSK